MPCLFRLLTGFYCPGCGGTRALWALLSGHPLLSFLYHPLVPYSALTAVWLHGAAADHCAARRSKTAMLPQDLFEDLGAVLTELES